MKAAAANVLAWIMGISICLFDAIDWMLLGDETDEWPGDRG
jgi:hypothetical protein